MNEDHDLWKMMKQLEHHNQHSQADIYLVFQ